MHWNDPSPPLVWVRSRNTLHLNFKEVTAAKLHFAPGQERFFKYGEQPCCRLVPLTARLDRDFYARAYVRAELAGDETNRRMPERQGVSALQMHPNHAAPAARPPMA